MQTDRTMTEKFAQDALAILQASLEMARSSHPMFYRVVALQLRLLLCDTVRLHGKQVDTALLPKARAELALLPLDAAGRLDKARQALPLPDWLAQVLPLPGLPSVGDFIRNVCDRRGGAHVDLRQTVTPEEIERERGWIILLGDALVSQIDL